MHLQVRDYRDHEINQPIMCLPPLYALPSSTANQRSLQPYASITQHHHHHRDCCGCQCVKIYVPWPIWSPMGVVGVYGSSINDVTDRAREQYSPTFGPSSPRPVRLFDNKNRTSSEQLALAAIDICGREWDAERKASEDRRGLEWILRAEGNFGSAFACFRTSKRFAESYSSSHQRRKFVPLLQQPEVPKSEIAIPEGGSSLLDTIIVLGLTVSFAIFECPHIQSLENRPSK